MPIVQHKETVYANISRDFMCLSPRKLIPVQRLCQYLEGITLPSYHFTMNLLEIRLECGIL